MLGSVEASRGSTTGIFDGRRTDVLLATYAGHKRKSILLAYLSNNF
jgi:hypothetical protein